jgi:hypothetical protein
MPLVRKLIYPLTTLDTDSASFRIPRWCQTPRIGLEERDLPGNLWYVTHVTCQRGADAIIGCLASGSKLVINITGNLVEQKTTFIRFLLQKSQSSHITQWRCRIGEVSNDAYHW